MKKLNIFEAKSFESQILGELWNTIESRKTWYKNYDSETDTYSDSDCIENRDRVEILEKLQAKLEKLA